MAETRARLMRCFSAVFPELSAEEIPRASLTSVGSWDSVGTITLLAVIEEEFGIQFEPQDLEHLVSFELILDHLQGGEHVS
jgi:acyl carrier protein